MTSDWQFSLRVALRYLWSTRRDAAIWLISLFSVIGVATGVLVLTITMAVFSGFQTELRNKILGTDAHIVVRNLGGRLKEWPSTIERMKQVPGVVSVSPFTQQQALITSGERSLGILIRGIQEGSASADQLKGYVKNSTDLDRFFHPPKAPVMHGDGQMEEVELPALLIGNELQRQLGILPSATVSLLAPEVSSTPFGLMPRYKRFLVSGTYHSGLIEYESGLAYMNLADTQQFFRLGDAVSGLEVRVERIDEAPQIAQSIVNALGGLSAGIIAQDWTVTNKPFFEALQLEKRVYFIVLLLIIVMASFSIISSLIMVVVEKRKDIAILRTLGASARHIRNIFIIQGSAVGGVGVTLGLTGGFIGCKLLQKYGFPIDERIFQMSSLPIRIVWQNFVTTGITAFFICALATIYPALRASRLEPVEVLRNE